MSKDNIIRLPSGSPDTPIQVRDKLQGLVHDDRLSSDAVHFASSTNVVYVSQQGDDSNEGRCPVEPKRTLDAALQLAYTLPDASRRFVVCVDASVFSEDVVLTESIDLYCPLASLIGDLTASASDINYVEFFFVQGTVNLNAFDHFKFNEVVSVVRIGDLTSAGASLYVTNFVTGQVDLTNAKGKAYIHIDHNLAPVTLDPPDGFAMAGNLNGTPLSPDEHARALETLTGDRRIDPLALQNFKSVGDPDVARSWLDFTTQGTEVHANGKSSIKVSGTGTRFNSGAYDTFTRYFRGSIPTKWPWYSISGTESVLTISSSWDALFVFPTVTCNQYSHNLVAVPITGFPDPFINNINALRPNGTSSIAQFTITGFNLNQRVGVRVYISKSGTTQRGDWRMENGGTEVDSVVLGADDYQNLDSYLEYTKVVTQADIDAGSIIVTVRRADTPNGTTDTWWDDHWMSFIVSYDLIVETLEPNLDSHAVVQFDSERKGILPPRITPTDEVNRTDGILAVERSTGLPIVSHKNGWSHYLTNRRKANEMLHEYPMYASEGNMADQGWTGSMATSSTVVHDFIGFPDLITCNAPDSTVEATVPFTSTIQFWLDAWNNGFRVDFRMFFGLGDKLQINVEPSTTVTDWPSGRYELTLEQNGAHVDVRFQGILLTNTSVDTMNTYSIICDNPRASTHARILLNDKEIGTGDIGGHNGQRGMYLWDDTGPTRDWHIEYANAYVIGNLTDDVTLTHDDVSSSIVYSNVVENATVRIPKGLFELGTTIELTNASTTPMTVTGTHLSEISIQGETSVQVPSGSGVYLTQMTRPRGTTWALIGGERPKTPVSEGHSLFFSYNGYSNQITNRHGTFTGNIGHTRRATGEYVFDIAGVTIDDYATTVMVQVTDVLAMPAVTTALLNGAYGDLEINVFEEDRSVGGSGLFDTLIDRRISVCLYW